MEAKIREENELPVNAVAAAPYPARSPVNTPVIEYGDDQLDERSLGANVLISGDRRTGRSARAKIIAEDLLAEGGQVVILSYCSSYGRLNETVDGGPSGYKVHVIDRNTPNLNLQAEDGAAVGAHVASTTDSLAIDLSLFTPEQVADFAQGFFEQIPIGLRKKMTIIVDDLDNSIARRRNGVDSKALKDLYATVTRGPDMGISVVMVTRSPSEIPQELRNAIGTLIASRTTLEPNYKALAEVFDKGMIHYIGVEQFSIRFIPSGQQWIRPLCELRPDTPFFYPLRPFRTGVGRKDDLVRGKDGLQLDSLVDSVKRARKERSRTARGTKNGGSTGSRRRAPVAAPAIVTVANKGNRARVGREIAGTPLRTQRISVGAAILGLRAHGMQRFDSAAASYEDLRRIVDEDDIIASARWVGTHGKHFRSMMTPTLAAVCHRLLQETCGAAGTDFLMSIATDGGTGSGVGDVLRARLLGLAAQGVPTGDERRVGLVFEAWNRFVEGREVRQLRLRSDVPRLRTPCMAEVIAMRLPETERQAA